MRDGDRSLTITWPAYAWWEFLEAVADGAAALTSLGMAYRDERAALEDAADLGDLRGSVNRAFEAAGGDATDVPITASRAAWETWRAALSEAASDYWEKNWMADVMYRRVSGQPPPPAQQVFQGAAVSRALAMLTAALEATD